MATLKLNYNVFLLFGTFCVLLVYSGLRLEMRTRSKVTQPLPPHSPLRSTFAKISPPRYQAKILRRTNARHNSRSKDNDKTTQSPQINTVTDAVAGSSTPNDQSCDLVIRDTDIDMLGNHPADRFSPFSQNDDGEDSDYVPESDSEDEPKKALRPRSHTYFLRNTVQREAKLQLEASADTSKARRAAS